MVYSHKQVTVAAVVSIGAVLFGHGRVTQAWDNDDDYYIAGAFGTVVCDFEFRWMTVENGNERDERKWEEGEPYMSTCDEVSIFLNVLINVTGLPLTSPEGVNCDGGMAMKVPSGENDCIVVAAALTDLINKGGQQYSALGCTSGYGPQQAALNYLYVPAGDTLQECNDVALKLSSVVADDLEKIKFTTFYPVALPVTGAAAVIWGVYAYTSLGGDEYPGATLFFALLVALRVFDVATDWGMYAISMESQHQRTPLRRACLAFSIIGSLLLPFDIAALSKRWRGDDVGTVGRIVLAVLLLEDLPQLVITISYFVDIGKDGRQPDEIAYTSLVVSSISLLANACSAVTMLY